MGGPSTTSPDRLGELKALTGELGQEALLAAEACQPDTDDYLVHYQQLSRRYPPRLVRAALSQAILRRKAESKFRSASKMYFEREALEQSSGDQVAVYRAGRYRQFDHIFDFGCGFGGDSLALAHWAPVVAVDIDHYRLALLQANFTSLEPRKRIALVRADLRQMPLKLPANSAVFFDPSRRSAGRRLKSVDEYRPPLSIIRDWIPHTAGIGVKCSPALDLSEVEAYNAGIEFISVEGDLKEAVLWLGDLKGESRQATLLPGPLIISGREPEGFMLSQPLNYIYEPDPAVMRARLVRVLATQLGAYQLDPSIALLTSDERFDTPFARRYRLVESLPFGLKRLRQALRAKEVGNVTLKKRGSAVDVVSFTRKLKLSGQNQATIILTLSAGKKVALWVEPD